MVRQIVRGHTPLSHTAHRKPRCCAGFFGRSQESIYHQVYTGPCMFANPVHRDDAYSTSKPLQFDPQ
ncbi:MAG: hypothetical protein ACXAC5_03745 [Promethearchaeota archaeon]